MTQRIEHIGDATLILGDCRELLPMLSADAVISDPPYGIAHVRSGSGSRAHGGMEKGGIVGDAEPFDRRPLFRFGNVLLWGADHYHSRLPDGGRFLAWDKLAGLASFDSFS